MGNVLSILAERGLGDADGDQDLDASSTKGAPRGVLLLGAQGQDSQDGSRSVPDRWVMGGKVTKVSTDQEETHYCILDLDHFWRLSAPAGGGASQGRGRDLALKEGDLVNYKLRRVHAEEQEEEGEDSGRWQVVEVERCTGGGGGGGQEDGMERGCLKIATDKLSHLLQEAGTTIRWTPCPVPALGCPRAVASRPQPPLPPPPSRAAPCWTYPRWWSASPPLPSACPPWVRRGRLSSSAPGSSWP